MTFDGLHQYACDAWGRMTTAAHSRAGDSLRSAVPVPVPRASPKPRDGDGQTLKQHIWGVRYIDELVQVAVNTGNSHGVPGIDVVADFSGLQDGQPSTASPWLASRGGTAVHSAGGVWRPLWRE